VFQATIQRAIPSEIVSFYVTPPSVWGGSQKILLIDGYDLVYKKMIKSMIEGFESEGRIRKNTITMYGAIALNDLTTPVKSETLLPLHALQDNKIMIPSDVEMHHSGTVQFNGETNDFFVGLEFTPIEADEALAQK
ncbi:MAG: hypothetical protein KDD46_02390, partial [Bdellovibrionales bacterium]|nr:hypothetical protein [Bdellovibrionales bacterium]